MYPKPTPKFIAPALLASTLVGDDSAETVEIETAVDPNGAFVSIRCLDVIPTDELRLDRADVLALVAFWLHGLDMGGPQ